MPKINVKLNSAFDTPDEEKIYVVEYPEVRSIKVRKIDLDKEIASIDKEILNKELRKVELENIRKEIEKIK